MESLDLQTLLFIFASSDLDLQNCPDFDEFEDCSDLQTDLDTQELEKIQLGTKKLSVDSGLF